MNHAVLAIESIFSIALITVLVLWLYNDYCVDHFRQEMYKLRDGFFDEAATGRLNFDMKAYGMLRSTMNGMIRFAHRLSLLHVLVGVVILKSHLKGSAGAEFSEQLKQELGTLSDAQRQLVLDYHKKMNLLVVKYLFAKSPILTPLLIILLIYFAAIELVVRGVARKATLMLAAARMLDSRAEQALRRPTIGRSIDKIDLLAFAEGNI